MAGVDPKSGQVAIRQIELESVDQLQLDFFHYFAIYFGSCSVSYIRIIEERIVKYIFQLQPNPLRQIRSGIQVFGDRGFQNIPILPQGKFCPDTIVKIQRITHSSLSQKHFILLNSLETGSRGISFSIVFSLISEDRRVVQE